MNFRKKSMLMLRNIFVKFMAIESNLSTVVDNYSFCVFSHPASSTPRVPQPFLWGPAHPLL